MSRYYLPPDLFLGCRYFIRDNESFSWKEGKGLICGWGVTEENFKFLSIDLNGIIRYCTKDDTFRIHPEDAKRIIETIKKPVFPEKEVSRSELIDLQQEP